MTPAPPRFAGGPRDSVKQPGRRFRVGSCAEGFEVVDFDGRPVITGYPHGACRELADHYNASAVSPRALAKALSTDPALIVGVVQSTPL